MICGLDRSKGSFLGWFGSDTNIYNLIDGIWRGVRCYPEDLPAHV